MEDSPETPRVCAACGGDASPKCKWCTNGLQNASQKEEWKNFRARMRATSGTYSILQALIEDTVGKLRASGTFVKVALAAEGEASLKKWLEAEHDSDARKEASKELLRFHRRAIALLTDAV
jgi:hypothetical protein